MSHSRPCSSAESSLHFNVNKTSDVFLSFRGPDTRHGFVRRLYNALVEGGISTFLDQESLEKGDHIPTCLERGIKESRICIPIFSKRFPESKWCLKEVWLMVKYRVEYGVRICPLFYEVLPAVLKCRAGSEYAEYFKHHESRQRLSADLILEYRSALEIVSEIYGWSYNQYGSDDDLIKSVVGDVQQILLSNSLHKVYLDIPKLFGLEGSVNYLKRLINTAVHPKEVVKVGIHGAGEIGKITLAKNVWKELPFSQFEVFCFVSSVGKGCREANGLVKLQTHMLKCVSQFRGEVDHVDQGKALLQHRLRGKRVLLLLDDIESAEQLEALAGNYRDFGAGSCVIITSRDEQILKVANVDVVYEEKVNPVRYFCYEPKEPMRFKAEIQLHWLTDVAIEGRFSGEFSTLENWRWQSLRKYSSKWLPQGMNLQNLAVLEVTDSQITRMWDEITQENPTTRPWKLKFLILRGCESLNSLPGRLCYTPLQMLDLHICHPLSSLRPNSVGIWTSLVVLDMEGCSVSSLPEDFGELANLQEPNLSYCQHLSKLPDTFGNLTQLERLEIHHNHKLAELPNSFGGLKSLAYLDVSYCDSLSGLPNTVRSLFSLVCLQMEGCGVCSLPQNLCNLANLQELNLSYCQHLSELPSSFGNLTQLVILEIHDIPGLTELPKSLGLLQQLTTLNLVGCNTISCGSLKSCLSGLQALEWVSVGGPGFSSSQLQVFYDSFKDFSFSKTRLLDNPDAPVNWVHGEGDGKNECGKKCIDYWTGENKVEYCAGYTVCLVCSGQKVNLGINRLSYKIERDDSLLKCSVNSQNTTVGVGDYFEVRLVRVEANLDFAWLKTGNKVRVNATSDYENWKASFKFLMYETTLKSEELQAPKMINFFM